MSNSHTLPNQQLPWLSFGQEINTTFKPVIGQTRMKPHSLVLIFYRHLWVTTEGPCSWGSHLCTIAVPLSPGCHLPCRGAGGTPGPLRVPNTQMLSRLPALDGNSSLWHPVSGSLPAQPPPTCLTQPIKAGIYSRQLGASTISHSRQEPLVRGVTGWKWWCLSPRRPHAREGRELGLVWPLWKMRNKLL